MVRVGISIGAGWFGGVNYFRNLASALATLPDLAIAPVLLVGEKSAKKTLVGFPDFEVIQSSWFDQYTPRWALRQAAQLALPGNPPFATFLRHNQIDVLSHSDFLGSGSGIPSLCWIPDFQHLNLPQLFTRSEMFYRNTEFGRMARHATRVILSSNAAREDLKRFEPRANERARVLQFVTHPTRSLETLPTIAELQNKYDFTGNYFYLPNQFWVHKNHELVIDALRILRERSEDVQVISTGITEDYRRPDHFDGLIKKAEDLGVSNSFKTLGVVPYRDLVGFMKNSVAVINPSRSEGWSTTVEEAKSLGKRVILSDLNVHKEQNPLDSIFVSPDNAEGLADAIHQMLREYDPRVETDRMNAAEKALPERIESFARAYQSIVMEVAR